MHPRTRMRRRRASEPLRRLAQETCISGDDLIQPVFIVSGANREEPVASMPGVVRLSCDRLEAAVTGLRVRAVLLFGVPDSVNKNETGSAALQEDGIVPAAIRLFKKQRPDIAVLTDICLCGYTNHGHCGLLSDQNEVDNDKTLPVLARMAQVHAAAGADMVAPSAMMDGQVKVIRGALDAAGFQNTAIMSYAAKFASAFYGPFRDAAQSAPGFGDRRSYQLPPHNRREAIADALLDEAEGADWLMVKPALPYLDVLAELRSATRLPIAAYQVSGEYAMLKCAVEAGVLNEREAVLEAVLSMKRAGADAVITYYAPEIGEWLGP